MNQDLQTINVIKALVMDGVARANSGHTGGAFSSVDFAYLLFTEFLNFDPEDPQWLSRDRFVLSAGHESMLLYALLHMMGWLELDDLKNFRQLGSRTPGHPENFMTPGVECTTGPLGQGAAMSVGMAIASAHLNEQLGHQLLSNKTFALLGDGCMQEDITLGAASYAGHLKLASLVWYYDRNRAQISGAISRATSDDEAKIFSGFGWEVLTVDGHDHAQLRKALNHATKANRQKPLLIIGDTTIAKGTAGMEGDCETHGTPLPRAEIEATKAKWKLPQNQEFLVPAEVKAHFQRRFSELRSQVSQWKKTWSEKIEATPAGKVLAQRYFGPESDIMTKLSAIEWGDRSIATRNAFGEIIQSWAPQIPKLVGGSADLEPSNMTGGFAKVVGDFQAKHYQGRNFAFGVREFPMSAICNGIALYGGLIPFDATFLCFSDYARAAVRLGALQRTRVIHEYTHDSFYLGEDGPTHQAVEHVMSLRTIPDLMVMRPADGFETEVMMREALRYPDRSSALCLSRQKLASLKLSRDRMVDVAKGAYVVLEVASPDLIIFATGSEVSLALDVAKLREKNNESVRVVSVPCWELFFLQDPQYVERIMSWNIKRRVSIEAGVTLGWQKFTGHLGLNIGVDRFGHSAPAEKLAEYFGFTPQKICDRIDQHSFS